jgi:hypothetical protein
MRAQKMFNALEMKLFAMGSAGEKHHHIASRLNIHHRRKHLIEYLGLIGV